ncbi:MAG: bifunctional oligoribonuclease/PAP phosphatase NrnA [Planctomycetota bacterium]|nr:MAG: bifunctional oligoribonuclease/PAP phosphatase NrnA [Planctomycetota bacterium]
MRLDWASLVEVLRGCQKVVLTSHVRPDCDALGSELGMLGILEAIGKDVRIVNAQATPVTLAWIDPNHRIESLQTGVKKSDLADRDLVIVVDTSAWAQLGAMADVVKELRPRVLVIDHHVSEDDLSDRWFKDTSAEATARIISEVALRLKVPLTEAIATPLYSGLSTDTGGFRFPSTSAETFRVAARLVDAGASPPTVYRELFEQDSIARLHLVGRTLAGARPAHDGKVIYSTVRQSDIKEVHALPSDTEDLVNLTLAVKGTEVAVILIEQPDSRVKVSFRSRGRVDCNLLAGSFNGGGHKAAAGAILPGPFDAAFEKVTHAVDAAWAAGMGLVTGG